MDGNYSAYDKEAMRLQTKEQVKELMDRLTERAIANVDKALSAGAHPEHWNNDGDYRLAKAIIDSLCCDRPYQPQDKQTKKDFANIRLFL